ncbi:sugar-binding domain-containing protein, partial [Rathayibacter rathayi]|uniref:sugar-binding domain-containing protein n=1 Tax=Rathayibacter rathayi TaxID=33887 RepID=UPI000D40C0B9
IVPDALAIHSPHIDECLRKHSHHASALADPASAPRHPRGALAAGLITDLILDEGTARALISD